MQKKDKKQFSNPSYDIFHERKKKLILIFLFFLLFFSIAVALTQGVLSISFPDVYKTLLTHFNPFDSNIEVNRLYDTVIWEIRLPRIILAVFVGIALAISGAVYQGCFRNPLVEPYILGVESGAAFGAALAIVIPTFFLSLQISAFIFGIIAVFGAYFLARIRGETPIVTLILSGVIIGSVFSALVSILQYISSDTALRQIVFWLMGGFYYTTWEDVLYIIPVVLICFFSVWILSWKLNVLSMGDDEAKTMGVNPERFKAIFITFATLATAMCVSAVGVIAWVGLMMPHAARMILGPDHRYMLPAAALLGAIYLIVCDTLARSLTTSEIPVGIITSLLGAPYLIHLIRQKGTGSFG
jgi:iron complex transport system permease protein